ncbi:ABC transporter permease [Sulfurisoma sediminicola]|uniref:Putative ABC transport system permease protein n=1 Tax=Sulfurisoma sediminicola TaxID=1381557 RepID=A0A497XDP6_9PROT|nr:FtsX-like permease family protein [Sulfurisoma sediminicola]RLJ64819.1 putative ABC transport system permease protein [Sulfurisoma sediminicola]
MIALRLMWRMLARDWRAGELTVLGVALVVAVAALTSVGFLADRVERGLMQQSHQLLGGDLLLTADHPWRDEIREVARRAGLQLAESATFPSMVSTPQGAQLAEIKAVTSNYPLRGKLRTAPQLNAADAEAQGVPVPGEVWLDERLTSALGMAPGTSLRLGALDPVMTAVLTLEPDRGINAFALAPRLLMNFGDLPASQLVQPGSRIAWRLHLAGEAKAVAAFARTMEQRLGRGERLESLDNARPEVRNLIERAQRFLRLAALLAVILAAVAVGLSADRYMRRHLDGCAVLRCLGARESQILVIHGGEFVIFGLLATLVGGISGYATQWALQSLLAGILTDALPQPGWQPWAQGLAVGAVLVVGFVLPPLLRLKRVPTVRVLRREWDGEPVSLAAYGIGIALLALLMVAIAGEMKLGAIVLGGFLGAILLYAGFARLVTTLLRHVRAGPGWRYGLVNLRRRRLATLVQAVSLGLGLTALLLLTVARDELMDSWRARVPPDAPNRFVINIQPDQRAAIADFFAAAGLPPSLMEPMVRGRLVAVNGRAVRPADYAEERAQRLVEREFNLSWTADLPGGNTLAAGRWHGQSREPQFSVEQGLAETLNLKLGDELDYDIAGQRLAARITSLRKLDWDSMRVNFFVIAPAGALDGLPTSLITSFHLPQEKVAFVNALAREFPNVTVIDVAALVRQLQATLDQVTRAVQLLFGFALAAGVVVLYAALQATADERLRELAVMRALGARKRQLRAALGTEFAALGAMAGLLGGLGAAAIAWALARFAFRLPYLPDPLLVVIGCTAGALGVAIAGVLATRGALASAAVTGLREAQ